MESTTRFLLRAAVLIGGCAAAAAIGLALSGPAHADDNSADDLVSTVADVAETAQPELDAPEVDVTPTPDPSQPSDNAEPTPTPVPIPTPVTEPVVPVVIGDPIGDAGGVLQPAGPVNPAPDQPLPAQDAPTVRPHLTLPAGPYQMAPAPTAGTCAHQAQAAVATAGNEAATQAWAQDYNVTAAIPVGFYRPPTVLPASGWTAHVGDQIALATPPPLPGIVPPAVWQLTPQPAGRVLGSERTAAGRDHQPRAPSG